MGGCPNSHNHSNVSSTPCAPRRSRSPAPWYAHAARASASGIVHRRGSRDTPKPCHSCCEAGPRFRIRIRRLLNRVLCSSLELFSSCGSSSPRRIFLRSLEFLLRVVLQSGGLNYYNTQPPNSFGLNVSIRLYGWPLGCPSGYIRPVLKKPIQTLKLNYCNPEYSFELKIGGFQG